jgi:hypothetical protein
MDYALDPASIDRIGATLAEVLEPRHIEMNDEPSVSQHVLCCLVGALDGRPQHLFVERDGELFLVH